MFWFNSGWRPKIISSYFIDIGTFKFALLCSQLFFANFFSKFDNLVTDADFQFASVPTSDPIRNRISQGYYWVIFVNIPDWHSWIRKHHESGYGSRICSTRTCNPI